MHTDQTKPKQNISRREIVNQTSYVKVPPEESGWRSVTLDMAPFADRMQIAPGPCWENDIIFMVTSFGTKR